MINDRDYEGIEFPVSKKELNRRKIFVSMYFVTKMVRLVLAMYQIKNLKIVWIYWWQQIKVSLIMSVLKILIDLCEMRQ